MDTELKVKWVKRLRSGKERQAIGKMCEPLGNGEYAYCCLGVLRKIIHPGSDENWGGDDYLSFIDADKADLNFDTQEELASMNDDGISFLVIADHIEANL